MTTPEPQTSWYAARIVSGQKSYILTMLGRDGVQIYIARLFPSLIFLRTTEALLGRMCSEYYGKLIFYRDPTKQYPQPIDDKQMRSFILVTSADPGSIIKIEQQGLDFTAGERVRVTAGPFEGAEGIVKRIKGDRRLVVSIEGVAAVATCFIHPSLLEPVKTE